VADPDKMARPMLITIDVAEHDRRRRTKPGLVGRAHDFKPFERVHLIGAQELARLVVEDLGRGSWQRAKPRRLQLGKKLRERQAKRFRALEHLKRRKRVHMASG